RVLDFVDQEVTPAMAPLARRLAALCRELRPDVLLTHAYEGGHPDHDAVALAAAAAVAMLRSALGSSGGRASPERGAGRQPPELVEMALYHAAGGELTRGAFLPAGRGRSAGGGASGGGAEDVCRLRLAPAEIERKRRMAACHASQAAVIGDDPLDHESF